ncbi:PTPLA-domain-containing protein [Exidia glandulosa HHB12029]|uniref:Very-long-chain (3R)-3-hydroxyacyl-CoA dehydratase n=1 Tax=Exidia glandulosa HHB12029 TaxID=1314781 RepID=A0A165JLA8_EXIGL|nr:PTPLA-domain-containing protein [Exidia glandulosa HHB12029]
MSTRRSKQVAAQSPPPIPEKVLPTPEKKGASQAVAYYLTAYNVLSALAWTYILVATSIHLAGLTQTAKVVVPPQTATSVFSRFLANVPFLRPAAPVSVQVESHIPAWLHPLVDRAKTTYAAVGPQTALVQSFAVLEILHVYLRWVRSPLQTTAIQVASRLILVWGIAEQYSGARESPFYATMVLSWSLTEVIRYAFYATSLLQVTPPWLTWLRYTTFYVLYPTGAGSEAFDMFATLPPVPSKLALVRAFQTAWGPSDYVRAVMFMVWWPGLYVMYTHMMRQRAKVLGSSHKLKVQ